MATTSIWSVKGWLGKVVIYVENPDKTDNPRYFERQDMTDRETQGLSDVIDYAVNTEKTGTADEAHAVMRRYVSGVNCSPSTARDEMMAVKVRYGKDNGIVAFHGYQSFAPGEATPDMAHEIGTRLASNLWGDKYQVIVATHLDKQVILMSGALAEKYNFKVGDKLNLTLSEERVQFEKGYGASDISANSVEVEIIGIYKILTEQSDKETLGQYELYENYVFTDMATFKEVFSTWAVVAKENEQGYESADFFLTDPAQLGSIMSEVSNISSINWNNFNLIANDEVYQASASSMSNVEKLITTMIVVVVVIAAAIITLILSMWVRSRVRETGILMSTGISKYKIVAQYVLETVFIAVFAFTLSYFTSNAIAGNLGHIIDSTIAAGDVSIATGNFILVCCAGIAVILAAIGISSIPVMRMNPREILSKMS